jgi:hypothetical protein
MKTIVKKTTHSLMIVSASMALFACGSEGSFSGSESSQNGRLNLGITDAAIDDATEVNVAFNGVAIKPKDGDVIEYNFTSAKTIDLLSLQNGLTESLLTAESLPAGEYSWIRLMITTEDDGETTSNVVDSEGTHTLYIPSGSETGLKLNTGFVVPENDAISLTIDFDLRKSIVVNDNNQKDDYKLKPSLRLVDNSQVGSFSGNVSAISTTENCGNANAVYVYEGSDVEANDEGATNNTPISSAIISVDKGVYSYQAAFLTAGNYTLAFTCQADNDDPETDDAIEFLGTQNATIITDQNVTVNFN